MKTKKTNYLIFTIVIILLITILFSIFLIKSNTGNATKIMDSKQSFETTTINNTLSSQKLTEFNIPTKEQLDTTSISQTFKENTEIDLKLDKPITALSVTGNTTLLSEVGLVRIILVDSEKHEYLVYETSSLLAENSKDTKFENVCEETCVLDEAITPVAIKIQIEDAILNLSSINTLLEDKLFTDIKDIKSYKQQILRSQNQAKIEKYNSSQKSWTAGETSVSNLSYEEQKRLFTKEDGTVPEYLPNLQGFLYYKGGIFTLKESSENSKNNNNTTIQPPINPPTAEPNYIFPDSWDWRNVHGENWITSVKNQNPAGTCMKFATMGSLESRINLYYNQHLNLDLSEQMMTDCIDYTLPYPNEDMNYTCADFACKLIHAGISDESCDPYVGRQTFNPEDCSEEYICSNWSQRTWIPNNVNRLYQNISENYIKKELIKNGPSFFSIWEHTHAVVLVGYENLNWTIVDECDNNSVCFNTQCIPRSCNNPGEEITNSYNGWTFWSSPVFLDSGIYNYRCENDSEDNFNLKWFPGYNLYDCEDNQISINGQCVSAPMPPFTNGFRTCNRLDNKILEYNPNNQDIWIFKNSWGADWGEDGYSKVILHENFIAEGYLGPITPPTDQSYWPAGFNNTINCEDLDQDGYCNWGISEQKPSTCPSTCGPERDCDDSNPDLLGFKSKTDLRCRYKYEIQQ